MLLSDINFTYPSMFMRNSSDSSVRRIAIHHRNFHNEYYLCMKMQYSEHGDCASAGHPFLGDGRVVT